MANNYLQFSEVIPHLTDEEARWCRERLDHLQSLFAGELDEDDEDPDFRPLPEDAPYEPDDGCLFEWSISEKADAEWGRHLWLHTEEGCDPGTVALFVQEFLRRFRPTSRFSFSWSEACSKPRAGEFGGGACWVSAEEIRFMHTHTWLEQQEAARAANGQST
jgi:hypothetical protein